LPAWAAGDLGEEQVRCPDRLKDANAGQSAVRSRSSSAANCNPPPRRGAHPGPLDRKWAGMLLRHATLLRTLPSIQRHGFLCSKSQGRLLAVWLATKEKSNWAAMHVAWRQGARIEAVVPLEVDVPRSWLRRSRQGLW